MNSFEDKYSDITIDKNYTWKAFKRLILKKMDNSYIQSKSNK